MEVSYRHAVTDDADLLIELYNSSFYQDYFRYGECPSYGKTKEQMQQYIRMFPKDIILCDDVPVGDISVNDRGNGEYYIGCLCVIPEYQNKGIGTEAIKHFLKNHTDWEKISLITPYDKEENILKNAASKSMGQNSTERFRWFGSFGSGIDSFPQQTQRFYNFKE